MYVFVNVCVYVCVCVCVFTYIGQEISLYLWEPPIAMKQLCIHSDCSYDLGKKNCVNLRETLENEPKIFFSASNSTKRVCMVLLILYHNLDAVGH